MVARMAMAYFGGAVAALVAALVLWAFGHSGMPEILGTRYVPELSWDWLGSRVLWGSLFALAYPFVRKRGIKPVRSGLILALLPSSIELGLWMPMREEGLFGLELGPVTPIIVVATYLLWGWGLSRIMIAKGHS